MVARAPTRSLRLQFLRDVALLALVALLAVLVATSVDGAPRPFVAFAAAALVPGAALLTLWPVAEPVSWLGLAVALSIAVETCASLVLLWLGLWHPGGLAAALGALSCLLLALDARRCLSPAVA
jgi:hypothetical protein